MRHWLVFALAAGLAACATQQQCLTSSAAAGLKGRRIATSVRRPTPVFVVKPNTAFARALMGGMAASAVMSDTGARIVRDDTIPDPAPLVARQLSEDLQRRFDLGRAEPAHQYIDGDEVTKIAVVNPRADLVLDVWMDGWTLEPFAVDGARYRVDYTVNLRLIDAKSVHAIDGTKGIVIARGTCSRIPKETPDAPSYDEFLANGGQRLKRELDAATRSCVDEFRSRVFLANPH